MRPLDGRVPGNDRGAGVNTASKPPHRPSSPQATRIAKKPLRGRQAARTGCGRGVVAAQHEEHGGDHRHDVEACGQFVALPGASGAGKSTLLRRVVRLDSVDGGTIDAPARPA